jgi:hypothetical protein
MNSAVEFDNKGWQIELRKVACLRGCQFPRSTEIEIGGTREQATITMKEKGLHSNMQTDAAAFEAWALALLLHCDVQSIRIGLDPAAGAKGRHYERFLYRLKRFSDLFRGRVIANGPVAAPKAFVEHKKLLLNQPSPRMRLPDVESRERMSAASTANSAKISESVLEKALEVSGAFQRRFRLDKVIRQWPVGLFDERVTADEHQIFTGGKSAIDLLGIRGETLVLFEIKSTNNRKAGAISELLFYANVMRDALGDASILKFESECAKKNCAVAPAIIVRCSNICAVLLAPRFHPLISEPLIFKELNSVTARLYADKPIRFETVEISSYPQDESGDFTFSPDQSIE